MLHYLNLDIGLYFVVQLYYINESTINYSVANLYHRYRFSYN